MSQPIYALVVDDETPIRRLVARALMERGFECDEAADGDQAADLLDRRRYDVVITDLRMPRRHGHSLATDVLNRGPNRPLLVIFTGVLEPRMAADLLASGVDDIMFKPVDFNALAAKVHGLWCRRQEHMKVPETYEPREAEPTVTDKPVRLVLSDDGQVLTVDGV